MNSPDVLGMVLDEAITSLEKSGVVYTINYIPKRAGDDNQIQRVIRQRVINKGDNIDLLIAYF